MVKSFFFKNKNKNKIVLKSSLKFERILLTFTLARGLIEKKKNHLDLGYQGFNKAKSFGLYY